jgi:hypothetical protein
LAKSPNKSPMKEHKKHLPFTESLRMMKEVSDKIRAVYYLN